MKILHVETGRYLYGGALQVNYLIRGLAARGIENVLACDRESGISEAVRGFAAVAELPVSGDLDLAFPFRLARLLQRERPDLVHVHSRRGADIWGSVASAIAGVPAVISRRVDNSEMPLVARLKYAPYRRVITISLAIRDVLLREGVDPSHVTCVHSAVDVDLFDRPADRAWFQGEFGFHPGEAVVAVIAQLIPRKGHRFLIDAAPAIIKAVPEVRFLVLGQGPLRTELEDRCRDRGIDDRVTFAGFRNDIARILPCLDLVVHPVTMEGLGVSLLQAAAAGVPIVGARSGGVPEIVRHGLNGLLVEPGDHRSLAEAAITLLRDAGLARRMGEEGKRIARSEFSIPAMVEGNLAVYRDVLDRSR